MGVLTGYDDMIIYSAHEIQTKGWYEDNRSIFDRNRKDIVGSINLHRSRKLPAALRKKIDE